MNADKSITEMNGTTLATEIVAEQERKLQTIVLSMNNINDLLGKGMFAITELIDITSDEVDAEENIPLLNKGKISTYAHVAYDYLLQAQKATQDIAKMEQKVVLRNVGTVDKIYNTLAVCADMPEMIQRRKDLKTYLMVNCLSESEEKSQEQWGKLEPLITAYGMENERQGFINGFNYLAELLVPDRQIEVMKDSVI